MTPLLACDMCTGERKFILRSQDVEAAEQDTDL